ncbi:50S ribosomal protein L11 methyltransferase [Halioxenophilus sp. WMMB6]|uniref:50S ribosomal protein L11 methyltransferase n=1 Tax=Halioxenophilus sp. WMMB6 TaxID=3073815 RepID=UPI00295E37D6|nr:50S ribosomal protein L11 methyltransferase [Halioxenophilus sp. WMMB6]
MPWLQLKINTERPQVATWESALLKAGALSVTLMDNADEPILEPGLGETPLWSNTQVIGLFEADINTQAIDKQLQALQQAGEHWRWEQLEDKDWSRAWMENYHPIQCGERLWIVPSWTAPPDPSAVNLMLDPGLAFGTGTHPTTFLCLQWLDQQACTGKSVIDYGCGSGILGIAALLLGAASAQGVDIDPQALLATRDNAVRNGLAEDAFPVYLPTKAQLQASDLVLANILAGPLVELAPAIAGLVRAEGQICLSGVLTSQAETVMDAYRPWIDFDPPASQEEWVRLTGRKRM